MYCVCCVVLLCGIGGVVTMPDYWCFQCRSGFMFKITQKCFFLRDVSANRMGHVLHAHVALCVVHIYFGVRRLWCNAFGRTPLTPLDA